MKTLKKVMVLLFFCTGFPTIAQESNNPHGFEVKTAPLRFFYGGNFSVEFLGDDFGISLGVQSYNRDFYHHGSIIPKVNDCNGFMVDLGFRKYKRLTPVTQRFWGVSLKYKNIFFPRADESNDNGYSYYSRTNEVSNVVYGTWGYKKIYGNFLWEYYFGAGVMHQPYDLKTYSVNAFGSTEELNTESKVYCMPYVTFGLNIGIVF